MAPASGLRPRQYLPPRPRTRVPLRRPLRAGHCSCREKQKNNGRPGSERGPTSGSSRNPEVGARGLFAPGSITPPRRKQGGDAIEASGCSPALRPLKVWATGVSLALPLPLWVALGKIPKHLKNAEHSVCLLGLWVTRLNFFYFQSVCMLKWLASFL